MNVMEKKAIILMMFVGWMGLSVSADNLPMQQKRLMNYDILELLDKYESCLSMLEPSDADDFLDLFVSGQSMLYNDLISVRTGKYLTAEEYSQSMLAEMAPGCRVFLKDIVHGEPESQDGTLWTDTIGFDKEILYYDQCEVKFSSSEYYQADYHLVMSVVWDRNTREIKIEQIKGNIESEFEPLPEGFVVLDLKDDYRNVGLLYHENELVYNIDSIAFLANDAITDQNALTWPYRDDIRLNISENASCPRKIDVEYKLRKWRVRTHYEMGINKSIRKVGKDLNYGKETLSFIKDIDIYDIKGDEKITAIESDGYEAGIDIGIVPLSGRKAKLGCYSGIGISKAVISNTPYDDKYDYKSDQDMDGDDYQRYYEIKGIKYTLPVTDIVVPLYLDLELLMSPNFALYVDAGAKMYKNLEKDTKFEATYKSYGRYEQYGNIKLEEDNLCKYFDNYLENPFNGFVNDGKLSEKNLKEKGSNIPDMWFDAVGEVGFRFKFSNYVSLIRDLYLNLGLSYQYTINPYENTNSRKPDDFKINYDLKNGEHVSYNLTDYISGISRTGSIRAKFSLTYRF